jgi:hypothetical protein
MFASSTKSAGTSVAFPDVCIIPAPPAPFVPAPYPQIQYEQNLKEANRADARAKSGDRKAQAAVKHAIGMAEKSAKVKVVSATQAVMIGFTLHKASNSAAPGASVVPSQTKILLLSP